MLMVRVVYLLLLRQVATVPISPTEGSDALIAKGRYEPGYIQLIMPILTKG